jgi:2-C-methyl-D-erythritol 2,4-cyclodiphosphate synthase
MFRIGHGYDVHRLVTRTEYLKVYPLREAMKFTLGGVEIADFDLLLLGHSDADVAIHALCDALLGALSLGDIGQHFPDSDSKYAGISSLELLKNCINLINNKKYKLVNCDLTIQAQKPYLKPYILLMKNKLAKTLGVEPDQVSVKATTTEKLGFVGREEGIAVDAVVLLSELG